MTANAHTDPSRLTVREQFTTDEGFQAWFTSRLQHVLRIPAYQWHEPLWPSPDESRDLASIIRDVTATQGNGYPHRILTLAVPTALADACRSQQPARCWSDDDSSSWLPVHIHRAAGRTNDLVCTDGTDLAHRYDAADRTADGDGLPWTPVILPLKNRYYGFTDYEFAVTYALAAEMRAMRDNIELFEHIESTDLDERVLMRALALMLSGWTVDPLPDVDRLDREHDSLAVLETLMLIIGFLKSARETTIEGDGVTLSITLDADPDADDLGLHLSELLDGGSATWLFQTATTRNSSLHLTTSGHLIGVLEHAPFQPAQEGKTFIATLPRTPVPRGRDRSTLKNLCVRPPVDYGWSLRRTHVAPTSPHRADMQQYASAAASNATSMRHGREGSDSPGSATASSPARIAAAFTLHPGKEISVTTTVTSAAPHPDAVGHEGAEATTGEVFAVQRHGSWHPWPSSEVRRGWSGINQKNGLKLAIMDSLVDASFSPHGALLAAVHQDDPEKIRNLARGLGICVAEDPDDAPERTVDAGPRPIPSTSRIWSPSLLALQEATEGSDRVTLDIRRYLYAGGASTKPLLFQELSRQQRLELLSLDGATIVNIDTGEILAVGAIVNLAQKQAAGGGRASAARSLAQHGVAFKVSQDGAIQGWHRWESGKDSSIQECLFLG